LVAAADLAAAVPERMLAATGVDVVAHPLPFRVEPILVNLVRHRAGRPTCTTGGYARRFSRRSIVAELRRYGGRRSNGTKRPRVA
jgi:hypothetical protein